MNYDIRNGRVEVREMVCHYMPTISGFTVQKWILSKLTVYKYSTGFQATSEFMCNIFAFKFKEFGNTHAVIKLLGHKSYHTNADPPNSLCKQCQQQYSVNKKMWLRERESKSEILCEERDGERRKRNIQIDNLLMIAVAFIFVFLSLQLWRFKQQHHAKHGKSVPSTNGLGFEWLGT